MKKEQQKYKYTEKRRKTVGWKVKGKEKKNTDSETRRELERNKGNKKREYRKTQRGHLFSIIFINVR
jgi:hypothetical protein